MLIKIIGFIIILLYIDIYVILSYTFLALI